MLSSQCDELRQVAQVYRNLGKFATEQMLLDAADTILELRDDLQRANAKNAELREEIAKARDPQRIGGQADPESFIYAIEQLREFRWQHATNDEDAIPYINKVAEAHERENAKLRDELDRMTEAVEALHSAPLEDQLVQALNVADKLRELVRRMWRLERFGCYGCRQECDADSCYASECKEAVEIEQEMRELGVETDG